MKLGTKLLPRAEEGPNFHVSLVDIVAVVVAVVIVVVMVAVHPGRNVAWDIC